MRGLCSVAARWVSIGAVLLVSACASLPPPQARTISTAHVDVADTSLARIAAASVQATEPGISGFQLMPEGPTALNARLALAQHAQKTIDAQYYILEKDASGTLFLDALLQAARRGVRVRLLVDDFYTVGKDKFFAALASQPNVELRLFNPLAVRAGPLSLRVMLSLADLRRINRRMHNKLFVADNSMAIVGGRNIADEYFMRSEVANFIDMDVLATGPVVPELSASFDDFWNSPQVRSIAELSTVPPDSESVRTWLHDQLAGAVEPPRERDTDVLGQPPIGQQLQAGRLWQTPGDGHAVSDIPKKIAIDDPEASYADSVTQRTIAMLQGAREQVIMISPYFIPGEVGLAQMKAGVEQGVEMIVLTNSLDATDESLAYAGYARYRVRLLQAGVRLFELSAKLLPRQRTLGDFSSSSGRLHAKIALVDQRRMFIGSMNLDGRSARLNTEVGILIESPALVEQFGRLTPLQAMGAYELQLDNSRDGVGWVEHNADGTRKKTNDEPGASWMDGFKNWLLLKLLPEDLL